MARKISLDQCAAERATLIRINRRIAPTHQVRQTRAGSADRKNYGRFYLFDYELQEVRRRDLRLVEYARRLSVAEPYQARRAAAYKRTDPTLDAGEIERAADDATEWISATDVEERERRADRQAEDNVRNWLLGWMNRQVSGADPVERFVIERLLDDLDRGAAGSLVKLGLL